MRKELLLSSRDEFPFADYATNWLTVAKRGNSYGYLKDYAGNLTPNTVVVKNKKWDVRGILVFNAVSVLEFNFGQSNFDDYPETAAKLYIISLLTNPVEVKITDIGALNEIYITENIEIDQYLNKTIPIYVSNKNPEFEYKDILDTRYSY